MFTFLLFAILLGGVAWYFYQYIENLREKINKNFNDMTFQFNEFTVKKLDTEKDLRGEVISKVKYTLEKIDVLQNQVSTIASKITTHEEHSTLSNRVLALESAMQNVRAFKTPPDQRAYLRIAKRKYLDRKRKELKELGLTHDSLPRQDFKITEEVRKYFREYNKKYRERKKKVGGKRGDKI